MCLFLYALACLFLGLAWWLRNEPPGRWIFAPVGLFTVVLAASFHYLRVTDEGDRLAIAFGPLPLFRRTIRYDDLVGFEVARSSLLDGWGIHFSPRGGWIWNIWGRDCIVLRSKGHILRVGSDDTKQLSELLQAKTGYLSR